jgi:hypothetical protein
MDIRKPNSYYFCLEKEAADLSLDTDEGDVE